MDQVQHQIGLLFDLLVQDEEIKDDIIESGILDDPIDDLDLHGFISETTSLIQAITPGNHTIPEEDFLEILQQAITERLDEFNEENKLVSELYFFPLSYKKVQISHVQTGAHYKISSVNPVIESMVNDIAQQYPEGTPLVIIIFQVGIAVKDLPMFTIRIDNPYNK